MFNLFKKEKEYIKYTITEEDKKNAEKKAELFINDIKTLIDRRIALRETQEFLKSTFIKNTDVDKFLVVYHHYIFDYYIRAGDAGHGYYYTEPLLLKDVLAKYLVEEETVSIAKTSIEDVISYAQALKTFNILNGLKYDNERILNRSR